MKTMSVTVWKITREIAAFEDDQMVGWDTTDTWYALTRFQEEEEDLHVSVADQNDCAVQVTLEKLFEIPEYDIPRIINLLGTLLPPHQSIPAIPDEVSEWAFKEREGLC